jgi:hypothetical protein
MTTSVILRPVPTSWVPQNRLSHLIESLSGERSPMIAIRFRLCGQRSWSAYDIAIGSLPPGSSSAAALESGELRLPM